MASPTAGAPLCPAPGCCGAAPGTPCFGSGSGSGSCMAGAAFTRCRRRLAVAPGAGAENPKASEPRRWEQPGPRSLPVGTEAAAAAAAASLCRGRLHPRLDPPAASPPPRLTHRTKAAARCPQLPAAPGPMPAARPDRDDVAEGPGELPAPYRGFGQPPAQTLPNHQY